MPAITATNSPGAALPGGLNLLFQTNARPEWTDSECSLMGSARWIDPTPEILASQLRLGQV